MMLPSNFISFVRVLRDDAGEDLSQRRTWIDADRIVAISQDDRNPHRTWIYDSSDNSWLADAEVESVAADIKAALVKHNSADDARRVFGAYFAGGG